MRLAGTDVGGRTVTRQVVTAADGSFAFEGLVEGTYHLEEEQPDGYADGDGVAGSAGGRADAANRIVGITLDAGFAADGYLFGEVVEPGPGRCRPAAPVGSAPGTNPFGPRQRCRSPAPNPAD